jgi:NitT/TauT family transport system substrate-binding protein
MVQRAFVRFAIASAVAAAIGLGGTAASAADDIKIGLLKLTASGAVFVAQEKGYFAAEGLNTQLVFFEASVPISAGVVAGDLDFGTAGVTASLYNLGGQGALRIIGPLAAEHPGFQGQGYLVSNQAWDAGLRSLKDFGGHSVALAQRGGPAEYAIGLLAEKYRFDFNGIHFVTMFSLSNAIAAVVGGRTETTVIQMTAGIPPMLQRGEAKLLGWVGDETPWQFMAAYTSTKTANERAGLVERFLRALRKGAREYHDAFADAQENRRDGPTAPEILDILAKYTGQARDTVRLSVTFTDGAGRFDVTDYRHQIAWYKAHGMLKPELDAEAILDRRSIVPLPGR